MADLRTSYIVNLAGNLQARAQRYSQSLGKFSSEGRRHLNALSRASDVYGRTLDRLGNRYTALISGATLTMATRQVGAFNDRLLRMGIQAGVTDQKIAGLKQSILSAAEDRNILVDPDEILGGLEAIVEKTGDLKFAEANIRNIGLAIQATGAQGGAIGEILAEFQKMGIIDPSQVMEAMDILNVQGKEGAFTLQNIAALGPRVITAYTAAGRSGVGALREMGAALQVIRQGTGSSEMAASAFEAVMRTLTDPAKIKELQKLTGISVFDPEKLKAGQKALRPINELMAEIVQKTRGDITQIGLVFDAEAMRAFNSAASEFSRTGSLASLEKFYSVQADGTTTTKDAARAATSFGASMTLLSIAGRRFADSNLAEPIKEFAHWLNSVDPQTVQRWLEIGKQLALVGGGLVIASKIRKLLGSAGGLSQGGQAGGLGGGSMNPIPVYIVGGGGTGGIDGSLTGASGGTSPGKRGRLGKLANLAGKGLMVGEAAATGYAIGTVLNEALITPLATMLTGQENSLGTALYELFNGDEANAILNPVTRQEVGGRLEIKIDQDGRARVKGIEQRGGMDIEAETGTSLAGAGL